MSDAAFKDTIRKDETLQTNIAAAKAVAEIMQSSLGPRGMDKLVKDSKGAVAVTNDGATILKKLPLLHPCAKMMAELARAQDRNVGDGTTTVVVLAGAMLSAAQRLLAKNIHPALIAEAFLGGAARAVEILGAMAENIREDDRDTLAKIAATSLGSKIVAGYAGHIAKIVVDAVLRVTETHGDVKRVNLENIRVVKRKGGTIEDMFLFDGVILPMKAVDSAGGPTKMENAKIGLVQFCLSPPKTDMDSQIVIGDYQQMDRVLREERKYILEMCKKIKKTGCNVLLIQKSILREALSDLGAHYLAKLGILVVTGIERDDIEALSRGVGCSPVADIVSFSADRLGASPLVEQVTDNGATYTAISSGDRKRAVSILCRGMGSVVVDEVERSLHDSLCVVKSLVSKNGIVAGGGAPEIEIACRLSEEAKHGDTVAAVCLREYAAAFETIPFILAENNGLHPVSVVSALKQAHKNGKTTAGVHSKKREITDMLQENVVQPVLVSISAVESATETVSMILKIDDWIYTR
ncbi:MAG: T-complex protein 1 subunit delta [Amphiamblys sp. WSBS2006]|nr:MAG: T-complex protein 1 subunit delta [Amphiamblys sp. WSBS2006]